MSPRSEPVDENRLLEALHELIQVAEQALGEKRAWKTMIPGPGDKIPHDKIAPVLAPLALALFLWAPACESTHPPPEEVIFEARVLRCLVSITELGGYLYHGDAGQTLGDLLFKVRVILKKVDFKKVPEEMKQSEEAVQLLQLNKPFRKLFLKALLHEKTIHEDVPTGLQKCLKTLKGAVEKRSSIWT